MVTSSFSSASSFQSPSASPAIAVVLIAGDRLLLEALPEQRGPMAGIQFVGRALDVENGRELLTRLAPQIVLLDGENFRNGFRTLSELVSVRMGQTRLVLLADQLSDTLLEVAINSGVAALVSRQDSLQELASAIRVASTGRVWVSEAMNNRITIDGRTGRRQIVRRTRLGTFSDRQLDVLIQLADGKRVRDIAESMHLSEKAIESHIYRLMNRLGIHDRVELCRWAIREGLISA